MIFNTQSISIQFARRQLALLPVVPAVAEENRARRKAVITEPVSRLHGKVDRTGGEIDHLAVSRRVGENARGVVERRRSVRLVVERIEKFRLADGVVDVGDQNRPFSRNNSQ